MTTYTYICGNGHSGSTLLGLLLGSHPDIVSLGEITHFQQYLAKNLVCTCGHPVHQCPFWSDVRPELARQCGFDVFLDPARFPVSLPAGRDSAQAQVMHYLRLARGGLGYRPFTSNVVRNIFTLFDAVQAVTQCRAVVDSSKAPLRMKSLWIERPSDVKVLYLVRDGRAVLASNMRKGATPKKAALGWVKTELLVRMMLLSMPRSAWMLVRYEDICQNPQGELARICRFVSLDFAPEMLEFYTHAHHDIHGNRMRFGASTQIVNRETWRQQLTAADLRIFERFAGPINRRLGYTT